MFDAAAAATAAEVTSEQVAQDQAEAAVSSEGTVEETTPQEQESQELLSAIASYAPGESTTEVVFVDPTVPDYESLIAGMGPNVEVVVLDASRDGVEQIAESLAGRSGIDAIHLISHGDEGRLNLGSGVLTSESMTGQYAEELATIKQSLSESADFLVYGCSFAEGEAGQEAAALLSQLTGADVAASIDATGYAGFGGDWTLETQTGAIETHIAVTDSLQMDWVGLLDISTGLIGNWTFDTNANDSSGNNYDGTLTNGAAIDTTDATDVVGVAKLSLDGVDDYVDLSAHSANLAGFTQGTIAGWIKTTSTFETIFSISDTADTGSSVALFLGASGYLTYEVRENGVLQLGVYRSSATINDGNWHHVAVTVGASGNSLYVDGVLATAGQLTYDAGNATTQGFFSSVTSLDSMAIGRNQDSSGGTWYTTGLVDDVRVYDRVLTGGDIAQLYTTSNDAPTITNLSGDSLSYNEGAGAVVIEQGANVLVADIDSSNFDTGTLTISIPSGGDSAEDVLSIRNQGTGAGQIGVSGSTISYEGTTIGTFTGGSGGSNLVITLNSGATPTSVMALIKNITYENRDTTAPTTGARTVRYVLTDGDGGTSANYDATVTVSAVNDAPTDLSLTAVVDDMATHPITTIVSQTGSQLTTATLTSGYSVDVYRFGSDVCAQIYDPQGNPVGAEVRVLGDSDPDIGPVANPVVAALPTGGFIVVFQAEGYLNSNMWGEVIVARAYDDGGQLVSVLPGHDSTGVMIISNTSAGNTYQRNPTVDVAGDGTITVSWNNVTAGLLQQRQFHILGPVVAENSAAGTVVTTLQGVDRDAGETLTYSIVGGDSNFEIVGTQLRVKAGAALDYETATSHTLTLRVTDSGGLTRDEVVTIGVTNTNDAPTVTNLSGDSVSYNEGAGAVVIEQGANVLVADADSANFDTGTLTISIPSGGDSAEDVLSIRNQGTGAGQIGVSGSNVTYGGVTIGTFTGGSNGTSLVITLNSSADATTVTALIKNITYANTDTAAPTTGARTVRYVLTDGDGGTSANYDATVTVSAVNDAPVLTDSGLTFTVLEDAGAPVNGTAVGSPLSAFTGSITDPDGAVAKGLAIISSTETNGTWYYTTDAGATWLTVGTVSNSASLLLADTAGTRLYFAPNSNYTGNVFPGLIVRAWDQSSGVVGTKVNTSVQGGTTAFSLVGDTIDPTVIAVNDAPVFSNLDGTPAFTEGGAAVVLDANVSIGDVELSALNNFNGATLTLARNGGASAEDVFSGSGTLSLSSGNVVVSGTTIGTYTNSGGTLQLTLNASATNTLVNSAMQQIAYSNSSDAPPASAQINWTFSDGNSGSQGTGGALTATGSTTVTITAVNDAPTITNLSGDSLSYNEGAGAVVIEQGANALVADADSANFDTGTLTISIPSGGDSAEDVLSIRNQGTGAGQIGVSGSNVTYGGVTIGTFTGGSNGSNLVITLNSSADATTVTALVKNITYENTDAASPTTGARTVRYVLTDGDGATSANYDATVTVTAVNDAPVLALGATNLLTNGSFESGATGWTGNTGVEVNNLLGQYGVPAPPDGTYFVEVEGSNTPGAPSYIEQTFTTVVGQTYVVSLSAITRTDVNVQDRGAFSINGVEIGQFTTGTSWKDYAVSFTATSTSSTLQITSLGSLSGGAPLTSDGGGLVIDHVQVVTVQTAAAYTEGGSPVVLAGTARVFDAELSALDTFNGATLTLARNGGAAAEDVFSGSGTLSLTSGNVIVSGTTIGTYTNSGGTLQLTLNASATNTLVNSAMQQIAYSNSSDAPPASAQINWTFSDGNSGNQGSGGALTATGSTIVTITAINDAPTITSNGGGATASVSVAETEAAVTTVTSTDVDGGTAVYSILSAGSGGAADAAQFSIDSSTGALAFSLAPDFEAPTDSNGDNVYEVTVQVADGNGGFATQLIRVSVLDVANTLTVSTTADTNDSGITAGTPAHTVEWLNAHQGADGLISLREAIIAANNTPGLNVIGFGIAGTGTHTILVTAALPTITDAVVIDATTDDSVAANGNRPAIALDGGHSVAGSGLVLSASADGSTIRGLIIRGFNSHGIQIEAGSSGNTIAGNYIGSLDFNGANAGAGAQNLGEGIAVFGDNNIIGGVTAADRNIISGNAYAGISVSGEAADGNQILGNYIGLDAAGTGAIGNRSGIWVSGGADATLIGGTTAAHRNVIAVTVNEGIGIVDTGTNDTIVQGNYIGTDATGTAAMGTGRSAVTAAGGTGTVIGGDTVGAGNVIANSAADGVRVYNTGTSASILGNAIYNNAQEGIDVRNDGVSLNDGALLAGEPNLMMDFPVFTESSVSGSTLTVAGYIGVNPLGDTDFAGARVEMFLSSNDGAYGEGQVFLGFLTADANGRFSGTLTLTTAVQVGDHLTATATSTTNQTSEFCANVAVIAGNGAPVNTVSGAQSVAEDTTLALSGISVADVAGNLSTVQLAVGNGRLDVTLSGGATISAGGNGTNTLTLSGSQAAINATLASLNYQGTLNFTGSDTLTMTSTDSNAATDMDTVAITVTAVNDAPTDLVLSANTVAENAANGTVVGTVTGTDPDTGDTKTYSFTDNAGGRFAINSSTGEITVADGSLLNYEATTSHGVTVRVTDSGNLTYDETFTISLTNVNEAPTGADTTVTITEDTSHTLTTANFGFSDVDAGDSLSAVRVDTLPGAGSLTLSGVAVTAGQVVTVADITAGNLVFAPAADANGTGYASLTFSVRDANNAYDSTPNTLTIDVTAVNDAPTIVINNGSTVAEGGTDTITGAELAASDVDNSDSQLAFSVGTGPAHGRIELTTAPGLSATSFTQADIVANRLVYVHDGSETLSDSFTFALSDGAGGSVGATTVTLTIAPVNDAPTITSGGGGATASINVAENVTGITMVVGADVDLPAQALTYGISGGIDQALFTIDATTGALSFVAPRNFEVATDANGDNVYVVQVRVTDTQGGAVTQTIQVTVTDVAEGLPPAPVAPVLPPSLIPMPPPSVVTPAPQTQALPASQGSQESMSALKAPTRGIPTEQRFIAERAGVKSSMTAPRTDDGSGGDERLKGRLVSRPDEGETQNPFVIMPVELVASDDPAGPEPPLSISEVLMTKLDEVARSLQEAAGVEQEQQAFVAHVTAVTGMTLSVGFVAWAIRSGSLLASCLTTIPAWRTFDPLPVVSLSRRERARWWEHTDASMQAEDVEFEGLQDLFDAPPSPASPSDPSKESGSSGTGGV